MQDSYPDGQGNGAPASLRVEKDLERLGDSGPSAKRRSHPPQSVAPKNRGGNGLGERKVPGHQQWIKRDRGGRSWKEANGDAGRLGLDEEAKRRWEKSGMAWVKKDGQRARNYDGKSGDEGAGVERAVGPGGHVPPDFDAMGQD